jgi:NADPH-dependent 2,4-dienoyl-CoA reductase/sulfur reductase-like enzyme
MHEKPKSLASAMAVAAAAPESAAAGATADSPGAHKSGVVIVGGGPAGYASAMMLARRGWTDITLVEAQADPTYADPDRSYGG